MHTSRFLLILVPLALFAAGCPDPEPEATPEPTPTPTPDEALAQECTNPDGFSVEFPGDWVTNEQPANELPPCSLFDPVSVALEDDAMHVPADIAVFIRIEPVEFEIGEDPQFEEVLDRQELTIAGREAVRIEVRDHSAQLPKRRSPDVSSESGRGLHLVEELALAWGVEPEAAGKTVWFEVPRLDRAAAGF
jgi:hypothetical protein